MRRLFIEFSHENHCLRLAVAFSLGVCVVVIIATQNHMFYLCVFVAASNEKNKSSLEVVASECLL